MKTYFLFHDDWSQYVKADLLASRFHFDGFVVIKRTRVWWGAYLWKRARRIGLWKVLDEALLRLYWVVFKSRNDIRRLRELLDDAAEKIPTGYTRPPIYHIDNINSDEAVLLLKKLQPDVCILMVNVILTEKIFSIPTFGMLVFHPGVTPEYRGPHSAFWATMNNEFWGIGWSLLRVDKGIDTGPVIAQGSCSGIDPMSDTHVFMQHKSHVEGVSQLAEVLQKFQRGESPRVEMVNRSTSNYTHPGWSDYLRLRKIINRLRAGDNIPATPKPDNVS